MAILDSVRELASKLGAETNGRDITDQLNKINKHLDSTASRDIAEAVSKFADKEDGTAILTTKSITENGTYNASSDNANGYSKVTVNVSSDPSNFTRIYTTPVDLNPDFSDQYLKGFPFEILKANDGIYNLSSYKCSFVLATPAKKIIHNEGRFQSSGIFTPSADYDGFYDFNGNPLTVASGSSTVTPNDSKGYIFKIYNDSVTGDYTVTIKKAAGGDFRFTVE